MSFGNQSFGSSPYGGSRGFISALAAVFKTLTIKYNMSGVLNKTLDVVYNIKNNISTTLTTIYNIKSLLAKELSLKYNIRVLAAKLLTLVYDIRQAPTAAVLTIKYSIKGLVSDSITIVYSITGRLVKRLTLLYSILRYVVGYRQVPDISKIYNICGNISVVSELVNVLAISNYLPKQVLVSNLTLGVKVVGNAPRVSVGNL